MPLVNIFHMRIILYKRLLPQVDPMNFIKLTLLLAIMTFWTLGSPSFENCPCINGGTCKAINLEYKCYCPVEYIGRFCQTPGQVLADRPQYLLLDSNFTYFIFAPGQANLYKLTFQTCMLNNTQDLDTHIFITTDQDNGSPTYQPSILTSAKIHLKSGTCMTFSSPYIQIKENLEKPFWRILIGVKAMNKAYKNIFFRSVAGKNHQQIPQEVIEEQPFVGQVQYLQKVYVKVSYEMYKETLTEAAVRILIKVLIGAGIVIALGLFCRIALFSYGIDTNDILLKVRRQVRAIKRSLCPPVRGSEHTYRNYVKARGRGSREEAEGLRGEDCAICLQPFEPNDYIQQTPCKHIYHENCLEQWSWKHQDCPLCRNKLQTNNQQDRFTSHQL